MKILFFLLIIGSFSVSARIVKPVLDNDLSYRYDGNFSNTERSIAGDKPESLPEEDSEVEWEDSSRDPSAAGDVVDKESESGIKYWKY